MTTVYIKGSFTTEEAAVIKAKDPKAILCDRNNYCYINFEKKTIKNAGDDDLSLYLTAKASGKLTEYLASKEKTKK